MKAILLVPGEGDPHGLLAPGKCGARSPLVVFGNFFGDEQIKRWVPLADLSNYHPEVWARVGCPSALVLAWNGESVPEGCDRAARALAEAWRGSKLAADEYPAVVRDLIGWGVQIRIVGVDLTSHAPMVSWQGREQLPECPFGPGNLMVAWALATVCAARLGCTMVTIDGEEGR